MTEINIQQDVQQLIHDVLTDDQIKSNPELITAVTGLLTQAYSLGIFQHILRNDEVEISCGHNSDKHELETFGEYLAKERWQKYINTINRRLIQKSKY